MLKVELNRNRIAANVGRIMQMAPSNYERFHAKRFALLLEILHSAGVSAESTILDVGPYFSSRLFKEYFGCRVDSMGFDPESKTEFGHHFQYDLNKCQTEEGCRRDLGPYPVIVFAEVIEHLYTAPSLALKYLGSLLVPGGILVVQTPNAVALGPRLKLLVGRHPYERISEKPESPNHFRESTLQELVSFGERAGLQPVFQGHFNYFNSKYTHAQSILKPWQGAFWHGFNSLLPGSLRRGMTVVFQKPL